MKKIRLITVFILSTFSLSVFTQSGIGVNTVNPRQTFHIDANGNNPQSGTPSNSELSDDVVINQDGKMGMGLLPQYAIDIKSSANGGFRLQDGSEKGSKVLTSDYQGNATWQYVGAIPIRVGVISPTQINVPLNTTGWVDTGSYITLPPGKWSVQVVMLLSIVGSTQPYVWVTSTFFPSADIVGSPLCSGLARNDLYSILSGFIIVNNTSGGYKTYRYNVGRIDYAGVNGATAYLRAFGSTLWGENNIVAYQLL